MQDISGKSIKGYDLLERIGAGGFGAVYRAHQSTVGREVAVKIILPGLANTPDFIRRFEAEARLVARLEHMHIVPLYDFWRDPSGAYLVMRLLRGGNLKDAIEQGPFKLEAATLLIDQITSAMELAHRNEVIHRDIKPANILMDEDSNAYLADFGIAKVIGDLQGDMTRPDTVIGSLDYISPEQARSEEVTPGTDIYSLGVVLYEMLAGAHPFPASSSVERLYKHLNERLPDITVENGKEADINAVIHRATAKNPTDRYDDVLAMAAAFRKAAGLDANLEGESIVEMLTKREQEVLKYIVIGFSNSEIAEKLFITVGTVKWYITQIYKKLGVRSRVQAMVRARELNLIVDTGEFEVAGAAVSVSLPEPENPYKGLRAFQAADHRHFFGREDLVERLLSRLDGKENEFNNRFLAVIGPSGSGKSSVVRAGLVPALWRGDLPGSERWFVVEMIPGAHPMDELEIGLMRVAANQSGVLTEQLHRDMRGLVRVGQLILPNDGSELVVIIDQFEEVFTLVEDEDRRAYFLDLLYTAASDPRSRVRIIVTLRADFYDRPLYYADFGQLLRENMETIMPLSAEELERAITRPAADQGVTFEPGLAPTIIDEVSYQPGALPLLQYALTELFERRDGRVLTRQAYQELGGTVGALAKRADEIYTELDETGQVTVRQMFQRLVTLGEGAEDTRRRVDRHELRAVARDAELMDEVIDTYAAYRLLSLDHDQDTRDPTVELAHEAILREWGRLREWLNKSRADIRLQQQLAGVVEDWQEAEHDPSYLLRGARLEQFEGWQEITKLALTRDEREFLKASLVMRDQEETAEAERQANELALEKRSQNRLRAMVGIFAVAALVAIVLTIIAFNQRGAALENEALAIAGQATATVAQGEAVTQSELAATRAAEAQEQRTLAEEQKALAEEQQVVAEEQRALAEGQSTLAEEQRIIAEEQRGIAESNLAQAESQRLAGLANNLLLLDRSPEVAALLALRGLSEQYTLEADVALQRAASSDFAQQLIEPEMGRLADLDFSPDGRYLLVVAAPGEDRIVNLQLWDLQTSELLWEIQDHTLGNLTWPLIHNVPALEEVFVATALIDGDRTWIGLLDLNTGEPTRRFEGVSGLITSFDLSTNGQIVAAATEEGIIHFWDVFSGEEIQTLSLEIDEPGPILVQYSPDNRSLATRAGGTTVVWDTASGEERRRLVDEPFLNFPMEFSADGRLLITFKFPVLHIWDLDSGEEISLHVPQDGGFPDGSITLSPDGRTLALPNSSKDILLWDLETDSEIRRLTGHLSQIWDLRFSPDGQTLLSGNTDTTARLWDIETGEQLRHYAGHTGVIGSTRFSPDGRSLATLGVTDQSIRIWSIAPLDNEGSLLSRASEFLELSSGGENALTKNPDDGLLHLVDSSSGQTLTIIEQSNPQLETSTVFRFSGDGKSIVIVDNEGAIVQYETASGQLISTFTNPHGKYQQASYVAGSQSIFATGDGGAYLLDAQSGEQLRIMAADIDLNVNFAGFMAVSPDGRLGAAIMSTGTAAGSEPIYLWNLQSGEVVQIITQASGTEALAFSHDGRSFSWGGNQAVAHIVDVNSGQEIYAFPHTQSVLGLAFSPDDRLLLTGSFDGTANLYDLGTGDLVRTFEGAPGGIGFFVDFAPDGESVLLNLIADNRIIRSAVSIDSLIDSVCESVLRDLTEEERRIYGLDESPTCPKFAVGS